MSLSSYHWAPYELSMISKISFEGELWQSYHHIPHSKPPLQLLLLWQSYHHIPHIKSPLQLLLLWQSYHLIPHIKSPLQLLLLWQSYHLIPHIKPPLQLLLLWQSYIILSLTSSLLFSYYLFVVSLQIFDLRSVKLHWEKLHNFWSAPQKLVDTQQQF